MGSGLACDVHMHAHINKCSVKCGLMPVKDPHKSFFFLLFPVVLRCSVAYEQI